jgi:hypothetical protein
MAIPGSVPITGFVAPTATSDTYATQDEFYNRGGWRTVADITARNAITADRRKVGMVVRVLDAGGGSEKFYTLVGGIADINWVEQVFGGGTGSSTFRGHAVPVEAPNGITVTFTLPSGERFQTGSLQVFLNGNKYNPESIVENVGRTTFTITGDIVPEATNRLSISYIVD